MTKRDRRTYIGSSDISSIVNLNKYRTAYDIWNQKTTGEEYPDSEPMLWGRILEPQILHESARRYRYRVLATDVFASHNDFDFLGATADAIGQDGFREFVVEIKNTSIFNRQFTDDDVPQEYIIQAMWLMGIHKKPECRFYVLVGGNELRNYNYNFDAELFASLVDKAVEFWGLVTKKIPPAITHSSDLNYIKVNDTTKEADKKITRAYDKLKELNNVIKRLTMEKDTIQEQIKVFLNENRSLSVNNKVVCKMMQQDRESLDKKKVKELLGDKYQEVLNVKRTTLLRMVEHE